MLLTQAGCRPAHLTRVRDALTALSEPEQVRLGVLEDWKAGPHQLTYRQTERTLSTWSPPRSAAITRVSCPPPGCSTIWKLGWPIIGKSERT